MSGVIDSAGQWEHCNCCGGWVLIQDLRYTVPTAEAQRINARSDNPWISSGKKLDLCAKCAGE